MWIKLIHTPPPRMDIASHDKTEKKTRTVSGKESLNPCCSSSPIQKVGWCFFFFFPSLVLQRISSELRLVPGYLPVISVCSLSSPAPSPQDPLSVSKKGKKKERNYPHGNCIRENYNTSWVFPKEKVAVSTPSPCGCSEQSWPQATAPATPTGSLSGFYCARSCVCVCVCVF